MEIELWIIKKLGPPEKINWQEYLENKTLSKPKTEPREKSKFETPDENNFSKKTTETKNNNYQEFIDLDLGGIIGEVDFIFSPRDIKKIIQLLQKNPRAKGIKLTTYITWEELGDFKGEISSLS